MHATNYTFMKFKFKIILYVDGLSDLVLYYDPELVGTMNPNDPSYRQWTRRKPARCQTTDTLCAFVMSATDSVLTVVQD